jgi:hypothetical protein
MADEPEPSEGRSLLWREAVPCSAGRYLAQGDFFCGGGLPLGGRRLSLTRQRLSPAADRGPFSRSAACFHRKSPKSAPFYPLITGQNAPFAAHNLTLWQPVALYRKNRKVPFPFSDFLLYGKQHNWEAYCLPVWWIVPSALPSRSPSSPHFSISFIVR